MSKRIEGLFCPECGDNVYQKEYLDKKLYVCAHPLEPEIIPNGPTLYSVCSHVQSFCSTCNKVYDSSNYGLHGDVYECKTCGSANWAFTDYQKEHNAMLDNIRQVSSRLRRWSSENP